MPRKMLSVPSVATIDGTRKTVTRAPLTMPEDEPDADAQDAPRPGALRTWRLEATATQ